MASSTLNQAILVATEAVRLDQAGQFPRALQLYTDACGELIKVIKAEPDAAKKAALKQVGVADPSWASHGARRR